MVGSTSNSEALHPAISKLLKDLTPNPSQKNLIEVKKHYTDIDVISILINQLLLNHYPLKFLIFNPDAIEPQIWLFENFKRLTIELNFLLAELINHGCMETCPQMVIEKYETTNETSSKLKTFIKSGSTTGDEWNDSERSKIKRRAKEVILNPIGDSTSHQSAIEYCSSVLDTSMDLISTHQLEYNSLSKVGVKPKLISNRQLIIIFKRFINILKHSWYKHSEIFEDPENFTSLYLRLLGIGHKFKIFLPNDDSIYFGPYKDIKEAGELGLDLNTKFDYGHQLQQYLDGIE